MSFTDDYLALRKKKKEEETEKTTTAPLFTNKTTAFFANEDVAPFASVDRVIFNSAANSHNKKETAPVKDDGEQGFLQKGAFDDGYQFGDVTKAILGTVADAGVNFLKGPAYLGEGIGDLIVYGMAGAADLFGDDEWADGARKRAQENLVGSFAKPVEDYLNNYSVLGRTTDAVMQGIGQAATIASTGGIAAAAGASSAATSAITMSLLGASSMGSGMSEAYQGGASDAEALKHGIGAGASDVIWEMLFGGLGKAVNAVGLSKGILPLDDMAAKAVTKFISNPKTANTVSLLIKGGFEGLEELGAGFTQAASKKLTYMSEEDFGKILEDENLFEQFIVGMLTSDIVQAPSVHTANKTGTNYVTGYSQNEQAVVQQEVQNRIAEAEKDGVNLTKKEKSAIEAQVENDLQKGNISTDTIEEVLGDKAGYDSLVQEANEFNTLYTMESGKMTRQQQVRLAELEAKNEANPYETAIKAAKDKVSQDVFALVQDSRLAESYKERARKGQAFEADLTKYDAKQRAVVQKAIDSGILNNTNRTHEFVDIVAKISADKGVPFDFANNEKIKESGFAVEGMTVDGYVTEDGITINIDSPKALQSTVGHEITHVLEGTELYDSLRQTLFDYAEAKGEYQSRYDAVVKKYKEGTDYEAELTADLVGDYLFRDADFVKHLSTNNRNVFQKIYDEIKYLCRVAIAGSKEAKQLEKVKKTFEDAYRTETKNTVVEDGVRYSLGNSSAQNDITANYQKTVDSILQGTHTDQSAVLLGYTPDIYQELGMPSLPFVIGPGHIYSTVKTEAEARLENRYSKKMHYHGLGDKVVKNIYKTAQDPLMIIASKDVNSKTTPLRSTHSVVAIVDVGTGNQHLLLPVEITAKRTLNGEEMDVNVLSSAYKKNVSELVREAVALENIGEVGVYYIKKGATLPADSGVQFPVHLSNKIASKGIIHSFSEKVNMNISDATQSQQFKQWFGDWQNHPENASKVVNEDGTPKVVYHGTNAKFNTFYSQSGEYWFSEYEDYAESMMEERGGGEVKAVYLNVKNPYRAKLSPGQFLDTTFEAPIIRNAKEADHDGVIIENDTTDPLAAETFYVVFSPEQIKSATDNIGTFDGGNSDIRYSLSAQDDIAPVKGGIYGKDIALGSVRENAVTTDNPRVDTGRVLDYANAIDETEGGAISYERREETREAFHRRANEKSYTVRERGEISCGYVLVADKTGRAGRTEKALRELGIPVIIHEGLEANVNGVTRVIQGDASSVEGDAVYVRNSIKTDPIETAGHEAYHFWKRAAARTTYAETVAENIDFSSDAFIQFQEKIAKKYFGEEVGLEDDGSDKLVEEIFAYITGLVHAGDSNNVVRPFLREYTAVRAAWNALVETQSQTPSVSQAEANTDNEFAPAGDVNVSGKKTILEAPAADDAVGAFFDDIAPVQRGLPDVETAAETANGGVFLDDFAPVADDATSDAPTTSATTGGRKALHQSIVGNIKSRFSERGYDFDDVLKNAKNLSTFATVDNTPQRVMEKALGYKEGNILSDLTVNKVAQNETEGIKWLNSFTDRKQGLLAQLSNRYNIKPGSKESAAAQMYAEGFYVDDKNNIVQYGDAELAKDFPDTQVQRSIKGLAGDPRIRQIYDDTLAAINAARTRNAYPAIPKLDNYFLHFRAMDDTFSKLGLPFNPNDIRAKDLPTDLNGVTADLKPGQPYFASAMHRTGKRTSFDLLGGLERYLTSAKNQIYHIDDIQTLRALRNYVADTYGQANGLEGLDVLSEEEAQDRIEKVYNSHLSTFAKFLNEEANILAGKTSLIDRGLEGIIGRRGITFLDTINKQVGSNMVGYNISSSLTNFLPVAQTFAKTNKFDFVKAFGQTVANKVGSIFGRSDGFAENSPVVIRRKGADKFYRTPWQKLGDLGYVLMSAVDDISTELIARTKYNELTRKGTDARTAHYETDKWVSRLMGDRSLGQQPQLYNSKMLGLITKFQLEVRNQLDSQFYDTIQETKASNEEIQNGLLRNAKTAAKVSSTFVQLAVVQHLFGKAFESVAGYNPAFDIIGILIKTFGWDDDDESEDTVLDNIEQGFFELLEDLPYTSTFTGGRIPISSALPIKEFVMGKDQYGNEKSRWETLGEIAPYYVLPGGYGQIKKTWQGLRMFSDDHPVAGSYTDSGNLRFPVKDTFGNRLQAGVFGQWANENAQDYIENGRSPLNEKQIQEFVDVGISIQDYWNYREGLRGLSTLAKKADYIDSLDLTVAQKNILINNIVDREEAIDMADYGDYSSFEEFDFATKNPEKYTFLKENNVTYREYAAFDDETKDVYDWAYENPKMFTVSKVIASDVVTYRQYVNELHEIKADKDENGKSISGSRKEKVIAYINGLDADYGEKIILFKSLYNADDTYNYDIIDYLNGREDVSYREMETILKALGFNVSSDGSVTWD